MPPLPILGGSGDPRLPETHLAQTSVVGQGGQRLLPAFGADPGRHVGRAGSAPNAGACRDLPTTLSPPKSIPESMIPRSHPSQNVPGIPPDHPVMLDAAYNLLRARGSFIEQGREIPSLVLRARLTWSFRRRSRPGPGSRCRARCSHSARGRADCFRRATGASVARPSSPLVAPFRGCQALL